jgi:general secretion pathway protein D
VIDKIDIRRAQVLVEAIIVEISEQLTKDLGVQILFQGDGVEQPAFGTRFGSPNPDLSAFAASSSSLLAEEGLAGTVKSVAASSLLGIEGIAVGIGKIVAGQSSFASILNAIAKDSDSNVLSTPSILTMDNETSSILVGQEIPITTGESLGANNANPFRTINRQEIGIKLLVTPQINDGDSIRLDIEQEVSSLFGPITESASEIITNKREIQTKVMVEDRQTVVLGGLIDEDIQEVERKVPGLGDIPVFGNLFKSTSKSKVKRNLVVFLKPTIIKNAADMQTISTEKYNYLKAEQMLLEKRGKPVVDLSLIETFLDEQ